MKTNTAVGLIAIIFLSCELICFSSGAKILFFYAMGTYSHKNGIWPLVSALADKGHNVTILSPYSKQPTENSKIHDLSPKALQKFVGQILEADKFIARQNHEENQAWDDVPLWTGKLCELLVKNAQPDKDKSLHSVLSDSTYDLMVINSIFSECGVMWAHKHSTKFIIATSTTIFPWLYDVYGLPIESSWLPDLALQFNYPMRLYDRVKNFLWTLYQYHQRWTITYPEVEKLMKDAFELEEAPSILELERKASLVLMNTFVGTEFARAIPPFFVQIGGMQCWMPLKPLPSDLQKFMDEAEDGVVLIAFGSTIDFSKIPKYYLDVFMTAVRTFPTVKFLWKWDGPHPEQVPQNLRMVPWLPQAEILAHPKTRAFMSHCGLNSVMESTFNGVPIIGIPLFGDQDYNAYHIRAYDLGVVLEARDLTHETMTHAVKSVLTDTRYKENMESASTMFKERTMSPIETGVFWTELVLRSDERALRLLKPLNYHQTWWQRRTLDVSALLFLIATFLTFTVIIVTFLLYKLYQKLKGCYHETRKPNVTVTKMKSS